MLIFARLVKTARKVSCRLKNKSLLRKKNPKVVQRRQRQRLTTTIKGHYHNVYLLYLSTRFSRVCWRICGQRTASRFQKAYFGRRRPLSLSWLGLCRLRCQNIISSEIHVSHPPSAHRKVWTLVIAPLTWVRLVTSSALQSRKWQLIGMSQCCRSALCGHPLLALTENWTHGAASRYTIAPISHTKPSPRSRSYYLFPVLLRVGGWVGWAYNRLATCSRLLAVDRMWVEPATCRLRVRYCTTTPLHPHREPHSSFRG